MEAGSHAEPDALIRLSGDEAVVLFELLSRWTAVGDDPTPDETCFESTAECAVIHSVVCDLERQLVAPFREDYAGVLAAARKKLSDQWGGTNLRVGSL